MKITFPDGTQAEVVDVEIVSEKSPWSTIKLADGSTLKMKLVVTSVVRPEDKFDPVTGNPNYVVHTKVVIRTSSPQKLKGKAAVAKDVRSPEVA
jgi:hypothetical protein